MKKIELNSLMGAVATFLFFQAMGMLLFEGLVFCFTTPSQARSFLIMWGLSWAFIFLFLQTILVSEVKEYIKNHSKSDIIAAFLRPSEWGKLLFVLGAGYVYWAIKSHRIPIAPRLVLNAFWIILCHIFSWSISALIYVLGKQVGIPLKLYRGHLVTVLTSLLVSCCVIGGSYYLSHSIPLGVALLFGYLFMFGFTAILLEYPKPLIIKE